jgi:hypothetical protein
LACTSRRCTSIEFPQAFVFYIDAGALGIALPIARQASFAPAEYGAHVATSDR